MKIISVLCVPIRKVINSVKFSIFLPRPISCYYKLYILSSGVIPEYAVREELMEAIHHLAVQVCWKCLQHPASTTPKQQSDVLPSDQPIYLVWERSILCFLGMMAVPGFSPLLVVWEHLNFFLALTTTA